MAYDLVNEIVSVDLITPDLAAHTQFFTDAWGLEIAERSGDTTSLCATGPDPHVVHLIPGAAPALAAVTYRCHSPGALPEIEKRARAWGCTILSGPGPSASHPGATVLDFREPLGSVVRVIHGDAKRPEKPEKPDLPTRLSHVNINTTDIDASIRFYTDVLGFRFVDRSAIMGFLSCNADHHAVVLFDAAVDGLNHVAFMVPELEGVMLASGRMIDNGYPIGWGVGRHGPGNNVFSYFVDPFGFVVEFTADVLQIDDRYTPGTPADWTWPKGRTDHWGIAPPKSDAVKAAQLAVPFG